MLDRGRPLYHHSGHCTIPPEPCSFKLELWLEGYNERGKQSTHMSNRGRQFYNPSTTVYISWTWRQTKHLHAGQGEAIVPPLHDGVLAGHSTAFCGCGRRGWDGGLQCSTKMRALLILSSCNVESYDCRKGWWPAVQHKDACTANFQAAATWRVTIVGKGGGLQSSTTMRALLIFELLHSWESWR